MKKICYFNLKTFSSVGGIENYNKSFIKALDELGFDFDVVSVYDRDGEVDLKKGKYYGFNGNKIKAILFILKNIYKWNTIIISHINLLPIAILAKILNPNLQFFLNIYGIEVWKRLSLIYRIFLKKISILSISTYTTNKFIEFNEVDTNNIYYLPPEIYIVRNMKINKKEFKKDGKFNILSVSRLDKNDNYKGIDSVINTIPLLIKTIPDLKYTVIGKGNDKERLEELAKKLKVEKFVEFKGYVEDIEPYYKNCDLFILPSKGEGFGIVYLEAMKYKKPCIACDVGGQTDVVIDGVTGFLCPYDDIECLSNKIIKLYKNPSLKDELGKNGYKHLIDNFTFEKFKERLKGILNEKS